MTGKARRTGDYINHMMTAIERITAYVERMDEAGFANDPRTQDAVIRNLEVLGEAARNVMTHDPAFVAAHEAVPWAAAYRMRNALSHGYADIDVAVVWKTVQQDLPQLHGTLSALKDDRP